MSVAPVREIHNLSVIELADGFHVTLHLKLPGDLPLDEAHAIAEEVEQAIVEGVPEVVEVQSHLEPLSRDGGRPGGGRRSCRGRAASCARSIGAAPRTLRFLHTDEGLVVFLTLALDPAESLAYAHATARASRSGSERRCPASPR